MKDKKFNNALEKAENISADTKKVHDNGSENLGVEKQDNNAFLNEMNEYDNEINKINSIDGISVEERARLKESKRMRRLEKIKRAEDMQILKMQKKDDDKMERERIKSERLALKREKASQRASLKAEKERAKAEHRKQVLEQREARHKRNSSRGIGGWLAAVIALGCACLALTTVLITDVFMSGNGEGMLANAYARNFYDLVNYVDNLDVNFSKLTYSNDDENKQRILCDIMVQANLAEADLDALPIHEQSKISTVKFINQVADFSKYLNNKLIGGHSLTESDISTIKQMRDINANLREKLKNLEVEMGEDFNFITLLSGEENPVLSSFDDLEYHSAEYPKMIYDGPFADEPEKTSEDLKQSESEKISEEDAKKVVEEAFSSYGLKEIKVTGVGAGKLFEVYNVEAKTDEYDLFAQVSMDGKMVMFDSYTKANAQNFTRDECIDNARNFLEKCGYKSIKAVWVNANSDNMTYINFACTTSKGEIVLYPDLIKVAVCMDSGRVCDMDAHLYYENHKEREIPEVKIKVEDAERKVNNNIEVETSRLAIIPLTKNKEVLAYEFSGKAPDGTYYVYIDAITGKEVQIFKVVATTEGDLLL